MPDAIAILHAAGLRRTPVRTGVIDSLARSPRPLSVADITKKLPRGTDVVTVYRTLNTLVEKGLARRLHGDDRTWLYEFLSPGRPDDDHVHAHFVCDQCGTVECLPDVTLPTLPAQLAEPKSGKNYAVTKQELTLHGKCPKCT